MTKSLLAEVLYSIPSFVCIRIGTTLYAARYQLEGRSVESQLWPVIGTYHWPNPSCRTMALGSTQYQEYFLKGKGGRCVGLTALSPTVPNVLKFWEPEPSGTLKSSPGIGIPLLRLGWTVRGSNPDRLWSPPSLPFNGYRCSRGGGVKRPGRLVNPSSP